jgi:predicted nucleic acid-binding protein
MNTAGSVLLDTSVVVAHFRGDESLSARFAEVAGIHMPWVVLGELRFGARRAVRP